MFFYSFLLLYMFLKKDLFLAVFLWSMPFLISITLFLYKDWYNDIWQIFLHFFLYFWLFPLILIITLLFYRIPKYFLTGIAFVILLQFFIYFLWSYLSKDSMLWIGYIFTIPWVVLGAFFSGSIALKKMHTNKYNSWTFFIISFGSRVVVL